MLVKPAKGEAAKWKSPTEGTELPYDFVPVVAEKIKVDDPIWHDGSYAKPEDLYSGELWCTLTTLTPMIVGNQQFELGNVDAAIRAMIDGARVTDWESEKTKELKRQQQLAERKGGRFDAKGKRFELNAEEVSCKSALKKKLLTPLRAAFLDGEPVLIPGESIGGMVRHSLGALMNAPMERVQPGNFSYRPNVEVQFGAKSRPMAGIVEEVDLKRLALKVRLFNFEDVMFVHGKDISTLIDPTAIYPVTCEQGQGPAGWRFAEVRRRKCIEQGHPHQSLTLHEEHLALRYQFGAPGNPDTDGHPVVLVPSRLCSEPMVTVEGPVVRQYLATLEHLGAIDDDHRLRKGDIFFCEVVQVGGAGGASDQVISFGHNFRYRWRHLNGLTNVVTGFDEAKGEWEAPRRPELAPHSTEIADAEGRPSKLTAVRNMFGYVVDKSQGSLVSTAMPDLKDPFDHLAGRVSFNFAMERVDPNEKDEDRFVRARDGNWVFLHPTVEPKPQHERSYVPGSADGRGWGSGLLLHNNEVLVQHATRLFAGRKFYLHQGYNEQTKKFDLQPHHYDLRDLLRKLGHGPKVTAHTSWELLKFLWDEQAQVARHVSKSGRDFGFSVRFKQLRGYELAALAAALDPGLACKAVQSDHDARHQKSKAYLRNVAFGFANKLGHGRALGLGSVRVKIDGGLRWLSKPGVVDTPLAEAGLVKLICDDLLSRLHPDVLEQWLRVLSCQPPRAVRPYLFAHEGKVMTTWTAEQRKKRLGDTRVEPFPSDVLGNPPALSEARRHGGGQQRQGPHQPGQRRQGRGGSRDGGPRW